MRVWSPGHHPFLSQPAIGFTVNIGRNQRLDLRSAVDQAEPGYVGIGCRGRDVWAAYDDDVTFTVHVPNDLAGQLAAEAARRGRPVDELDVALPGQQVAAMDPTAPTPPVPVAGRTAAEA